MQISKHSLSITALLVFGLFGLGSSWFRPQSNVQIATDTHYEVLKQFEDDMVELENHIEDAKARFMNIRRRIRIAFLNEKIKVVVKRQLPMSKESLDKFIEASRKEIRELENQLSTSKSAQSLMSPESKKKE